MSVAVACRPTTHVACESSVDFASMQAEDFDVSTDAEDTTSPAETSSKQSAVSDNGPSFIYERNRPAVQSSGCSSETMSIASVELDPDAPKMSSICGKSRKGKRLLWQFLLHDLLTGRSDLSWHPNQLENPGVFSFKDPNSAAKRWGFYKGNENMSYEKMSRCIRDYYTRQKNFHYGVMQPDQPVTTTTDSSSSSSSCDPPTKSATSQQRRRLHFAFNLRHPTVSAFIKQHSAGYFHRLVRMKLVV